MPTQRLLWTALPNGLTDDQRHVRVSVMMSPRLDPQAGDERLETFPRFTNWPATVRAAEFTISLGTHSVILTGRDADATLDVPDGATWEALFPPTTLVRGHTYRDRSGHKVVSYDAVAAHEAVRGFHTAMMAAGGDELPTVRDLLQTPFVRDVVHGVAKSDRELQTERLGGPRDIERHLEQHLARAKKVGTAAEALVAVQLFNTPPSKPEMQHYTAEEVPDPKDPRRKAAWRTHARAALPAAADFATLIDFHQMVGAMNQYPRLLRRLGLVLDFVVPLGSFKVGTSQPLRAVVKLQGATVAGVTTRSASPRTMTRFTATTFEALPRPSDAPYRLKGGLLRTDEQFVVLQADVDGAATKVMNFARTLAYQERRPDRLEDPVTRFWQRAGAPAVRTAGLMLVQRRRAAMLEGAFSRNNDLNSAVELEMNRGGTPAAFYREDLVRGFRFDVWNGKTKRWNSLCERIARYTIGGGAVTLEDVREETTVRLAATTAADDSRPNLLWLHEVMMAWSGWSLAARPPMRAILADDRHKEGDPPPVGDGVPEVPPGIRLDTRFEAAPGTLPRLRYGRNYALRARAVDLAGNSLPPSGDDYGDEKPADHAAVFRRFEPIASPALALARAAGVLEKPAEGESMERLAFRTLNETYNDPTPSPFTSRRFAVVPRASVREAELHGMLDADGVVDAATFALLADRDADLASETFDQVGPLGGQAAPVTYAVLDEGARLPYLPDPLCTGLHARFFGHPAITKVTLIPIPVFAGAKWPDVLPFEIRTYEGTGEAPHFDEATRTLMVPLPKGYRVTLRISAVPSPNALKLMGVWYWLTEGQRNKLRSLALKGLFWPLTPWRDIELVHATQRPLIRPEIQGLKLTRHHGRTFVTLAFLATTSLRSTARVDLQAAWHEPRATPDVEGGDDVAKTDHAFSGKITDPSRYQTQEDDPASSGRADHTIHGPDLIGLGSVARLAPPRHHQFGDTRYRRIEYWLEGTTRFREFLTTDLLTVPSPEDPDDPNKRVPTDARINIVGERVRTWVPSSASPPAPAVLYVMPTFGWTRGADPQGRQTSWRRGGGLRVYLGGAWNASGYGEMLAVTLLPPHAADDPNDKPYRASVTQWGNDPAWKSPFVKGVSPTIADFPLSRTAADPTGDWLPEFAPATEADQPPGAFRTTGLTYPGLSVNAAAGRVDIAPHDVRWDDERRLWYCDIEVRPGTAYFPFLRLALARYQPVSVEGAHLSNIVIADFMALAPDRWLSVARGTTSRHRVVRVMARGPEESAGHAESMKFARRLRHPVTGKIATSTPSGIAQGNVIEVTVERLDPALGEDFGWLPVSDATIAEGVVSGPLRPRPDARRLTRARELQQAGDHLAIVQEGLLDSIVELAAQWEGTVTLPTAPSSGVRYRLVIAEYEQYLVDDAVRSDSPTSPEGFPEPYVTPPIAKDRRLVFVEHVELT